MPKLPENYEELQKNEIEHWKVGLENLDEKKGEVPGLVPKIDGFVEAYEIQKSYLTGIMKNMKIVPWIREKIKEKNEKSKIISIGCGTGNWEMKLLKNCSKKVDLELLELGEDVLKFAKNFAKENKLEFGIKIQDANKLQLKENEYDFVIVRSYYIISLS